MSTSIFVLTNQYMQLAHQLADLDLDATTVADTMEASGIVDNITDKFQAIEYVARGAESNNAAIDAEIARLQALKAKRIDLAAKVRGWLKDSMEAMQIERIDCPLFCISIRKNPPAVDIFDALSLPAKYMVTPPPKPPVAAPDRNAIAAAIKAGIDVPGARLTQATRLSIS